MTKKGRKPIQRLYSEIVHKNTTVILNGLELSMREVATLLDWSPSQIARLAEDQSSMRLSDAVILCSMADISLSDFVKRELGPEEISRVKTIKELLMVYREEILGRAGFKKISGS